MFATKSDLLPPQYVAALKSVFDDCPAVDSKRVRKIVEEELGGPVGELFHDFTHEAGVSSAHEAPKTRYDPRLFERFVWFRIVEMGEF